MTAGENYNSRLFQILSNDSFSSSFISGIAGDRIQDSEEKELYERLLKETGSGFYVSLLFFITHELFERKQAAQLWKEIVAHKKKLSRVLKRNVEITVATLDYLTNVKKEIKNPKLIGEAFIGRMAEMSSFDPLTKLFNRQHVAHVIEVEFARYNRYHIPFSLVMIDIDHFKNINDTHGHQEGDFALIELSAVLRSTVRDLDVCCRYGGEEFLVVLPHTDKRESSEMAERIRYAVQARFAGNLDATISLGISNCPKSATTIEDLIRSADDALYESKNSGRNKVSFA